MNIAPPIYIHVTLQGPCTLRIIRMGEPPSVSLLAWSRGGLVKVLRCSPPQSYYLQGWRLPEFPAVHTSSWIFQQQHPAQLQKLAWEKPGAEHWGEEWEVARAAASYFAAAAGLSLSLWPGLTSARGKIYICKHSALLSLSIVSSTQELEKPLNNLEVSTGRNLLVYW